MATRVTITKALEARLRDYVTREKDNKLVEEIVNLLDDEQGKRAASFKESEAKQGLGYRELVALLRSFLGDYLITPPKPSTSFIVKIVNKTKEQGIDSTNVEQILRGLQRVARAPYRLADIVYNADRYFYIGESASDHNDAEDNDAEEGLYHTSGRVFTGRADD